MPRLRPRLASGLFAFALAGLGCHRVVVDDVRGPDGGDWKRISCRRMDKKCYSAAAQMCPNGYYFAKAAGPSPAAVAHAHEDDADDDDVASSSGKTRASGPHPQAGNVKTLPPQERWGSGMYSRHGGTILVQCADVRASASN